MFILINTISAHQVEDLREEDEKKKSEFAFLSFDNDFDYIKKGEAGFMGSVKAAIFLA